MKIPTVEAELFYAGWRTDGQTMGSWQLLPAFLRQRLYRRHKNTRSQQGDRKSSCFGFTVRQEILLTPNVPTAISYRAPNREAPKRIMTSVSSPHYISNTQILWEKFWMRSESQTATPILITLLYRVIRNDCRGFNNLSYTIHFR